MFKGLMKKQFLIALALLLVGVLFVHGSSDLFIATADEIRSNICSENVIEKDNFGITDLSIKEKTLSDTKEETPYILGENTSKRTETSKEFYLDDGTLLVEYYPEPVHYYDSEALRYKEIDNSLHSVISDDGREVFRNAANALSVEFSKTVLENRDVVALSLEEYYLGFRMITEAYSESISKDLITAPTISEYDSSNSIDVSSFENLGFEAANVQSVKTEGFYGENLYEGKKLTKPIPLSNGVSKIAYKSLEKSVDLEYELNSRGVKENIIVNERADVYEYAFELNTKGLRLISMSDGSITVRNESGDEIFSIPVPFMVDAENAYSNDVKYDLIEIGEDVYKLQVSASAEWINSPDTVLPVRIDPFILFQPDFSSITVYQNGGREQNNNEGYAGKNSSAVLFNFYMSYSLSSYNKVQYTPLESTFRYTRKNQANLLNMVGHDCYITTPVSDINNLYYSNRPANQHWLAGENVLHTIGLKETFYSTIPLDYLNRQSILTIGFVPKDNGSNRYAIILLAGSDRPNLQVRYAKIGGLSSDYGIETFSSQGIDNHINILTNQLTSVIHLMTVNQFSMPFNISVVYNNGYSDELIAAYGSEYYFANTTLGKDMKLSLDHYITSTENENIFTYTDGSGHTHVLYKIVENLPYTLEYACSDCDLIYNRSDNTLKRYGKTLMDFSLYNRPVKIYDENDPSNYLLIKYVLDIRINRIQLFEHGKESRWIDFYYDSNGNIEYLLSSLGEQVDLIYDTAGRLIEIRRGNSTNRLTTARMLYDNSNNLTEIYDKDNNGYTFFYISDYLLHVQNAYYVSANVRHKFNEFVEIFGYEVWFYGSTDLESLKIYSFDKMNVSSIVEYSYVTKRTITTNITYPANNYSKENKKVTVSYPDNISQTVSRIRGADTTKIVTEASNGENTTYTYRNSDNKIINAIETADGVNKYTYYDYSPTGSNPYSTTITQGNKKTIATTTIDNAGASVTTTANYYDNKLISSTKEKRESNGTLSMTRDESGVNTYYSYGLWINNIQLMSKIICSSTDENTAVAHPISGVHADDITCSYGYDILGTAAWEEVNGIRHSYNNTSVTGAGVTYTYNKKPNGLLDSITSASGSVGYTYNSMQLSTETFANGVTATYTGSGNNAKVNYSGVNSDGQSFESTYNPSGKLLTVQSKENNTLTIEQKYLNISPVFNQMSVAISGQDTAVFNSFYTDSGYMTVQGNALGSTNRATIYGYDSEKRLSSVEDENFNSSAVYSDAQQKIEYTQKNNSNLINSSVYNYENGRLSTYNDGQYSYGFDYDSFGRTKNEYRNGSVTNSYNYDKQNRLIYSKNGSAVPLSYEYDNNGNILYVKSNGQIMESYLYNPSNNRLNTYIKDGNTYNFSYDNMGYPTRYKSTGSANNMTWARDGRLTSYNYNGFNNTYKYDANGLRYKKTTSEGTKYHYYSENGDIIFEKINGTAIYYLYDMRGVAGMVCNEQTFYFRKNHSGDITAIIAQNGVLAATYTYDAWGNTAQVSYPAAIVGGMDIGIMNPWRYRSYYYDTESNLYYLQQRYYDPQIRRFISPDSLDILPMLAGYVGQLNLYAYCNNNPVMMTDSTGQSPKWWQWTLFGVGAALVVAAAVVLTVVSCGAAAAPAGMVGTIVMGAAKGALIGAAIGSAVGVAGGAIYAGVTGADMGDSILQGFLMGFGGGAIIGAVVGGAIGAATYNPGVQWTSSRLHAGQRMAERGINQNMIKTVLRTGKYTMQTIDKFLVSGQITAVITAAGELITVWWN